MALTSAQLADLVRRHFPAGTVLQTGHPIQVTAYAVARAESGGRPDAIGDGGQSFGLWQVYRPAHPQYPAAWLLDPENNASAAYTISRAGLNWNPWCTWEGTACGGAGNGRYRAFLAEAGAALESPPPPPPPPPPPVDAGNPGTWGLLLAGGGLLLLAATRSSRPADR
jgi:Lysozyme like domain